LATIEPHIICGSQAEREERGQRLAKLFIGEMIPLLVQVRQDFWDKGRDETICGVKTFTEYCTGILRYSEGYIRRLIQGQNPASKKHDGSDHRKPTTKPPKEETTNKSATTNKGKSADKDAEKPLGRTAELRTWFTARYEAFTLSPTKTGGYDLTLNNLTPVQVKAVGELLASRGPK
jgi:hypothetical protein